MKRAPILPVAALLLLGACGGSPAPAPAPAESAEMATCREEARNASSVADFARQMNPSNPTQMDRIQAQRDEAESRAYRDCLRRRGVTRGGGVEPVRRQGIF